MIFTVTGGKGGTGKSTVAVNLAWELSKKFNVVLADVDVECPNDHILLSAKLDNEREEHIFKPKFDYEKCIKCSLCAKNCSENAIILFSNGYPFLMPTLCTGCKTCKLVCPVGAVKEDKKIIGHTYVTKVNENFTLVSGILNEGEERSYPLVLSTKKRAFEISHDILIFDTSSGTGNHVAAAIEDSDLVIVVTEPTPLGLHDLKKIFDLLKKQNKIGYGIMNRYNIVDEIPNVNGVEFIGKIQVSDKILKSYISGSPVVKMFPESDESRIFSDISNKVVHLLWRK